MAAAAAGRRVLGTGGGRGLGAAIVEALAAAGHDVTFTYRSAQAEAEQALQALAVAHPGQSFTARHVDLADTDAVEAFAGALPGTPTTPWR
jgi:NAD(P)-dependent dehydrogenase (short-subunit alcohol dehydrogenase family)